MNIIPCALQSPRVSEDGVIHWYEGDTFILTFDVEFIDELGQKVNINENDVITISFRDIYDNIIQEFEQVGSDVIEMIFDESVSNKFKVGEYQYCARLNNGWIKTFMRKNVVIVE